MARGVHRVEMTLQSPWLFDPGDVLALPRAGQYVNLPRYVIDEVVYPLGVGSASVKASALSGSTMVVTTDYV
jgi:hypothetical protein